MNFSDFKSVLRKKNVFWNPDPEKDYSDETVVEYALMRADWPELKQLFLLMPEEKIRNVWMDRLTGDAY